MKKYAHLAYHAGVVNFARLFVPRFLTWLFRSSASGLDAVKISPPFIVLAQHSCVWDPLMYNQYIRAPLHFVVSDAQFRTPIMRFIMRLVGSIPKKKAAKDIRAVAEMLHVLQHKKESLCIFPEGLNTWDGASLPVPEATAKLIKRACVPVVCAKSHGAYLSRPRWGAGIRRGAWRVYFSRCLSPREIASMDEPAILARISEHLATNEFTHQQKNAAAFISARSAERIERVLFACPHCLSTQRIMSRGSLFHCDVCCNLWRVRADGMLIARPRGPLAPNEGAGAARDFTTIAEWNAWQLDFLRDYIQELVERKADTAIFYDENVELRFGARRLADTLGEGSCSLTTSHFIFTPARKKNNAPRVFPVADMRSINVQNNEKLEWTAPNGITYQLRSRRGRANTYKYMQAVLMLQGGAPIK